MVILATFAILVTMITKIHSIGINENRSFSPRDTFTPNFIHKVHGKNAIVIACQDEVSSPTSFFSEVIEYDISGATTTITETTKVDSLILIDYIFEYKPTNTILLVSQDKFQYFNINPDLSRTTKVTWLASDYLDAELGTGFCREGTSYCYIGSKSSSASPKQYKLIRVEPGQGMDTKVSTINLPYQLRRTIFNPKKSLTYSIDSNSEYVMMLDITQIDSPPTQSSSPLANTGTNTDFVISEEFNIAIYSNQNNRLVTLNLTNTNMAIKDTLDTSGDSYIPESLVVVYELTFVIIGTDQGPIYIVNILDLSDSSSKLISGIGNFKHGSLIPGYRLLWLPSLTNKYYSLLQLTQVPCHNSCSSCDPNAKGYKDPSQCSVCELNYEEGVSTGPGTFECDCLSYQRKFTNTETKTCDYCSDTCLTCNEAASKCSSCNSTLYLAGDDCLLQCPEGFMANDATRECDKCTFPCSECSGSVSSCDSCFGGLSLFQNECYQECPQGNFKDFGGTGNCELCIDCETCFLSSTNCISCSSTLVLHNSQCLSECPVGTLRNEENECQECWGRCQTCSFLPTSSTESKYACLTCKGDLVVVQDPDSDTDNCGCPEGMTFDIPAPQGGTTPSISGITACRPRSAKELIVNSLKIEQAQFFPNLKSVSIKFEEKIQNSTFSNLQFLLRDIEQPTKISNISTKNISIIEKNILKITFKIEDNISNQQLEITSNNFTEIRSKESTKIFSSYPIKLIINYYENAAVKATVKAVGSGISLLSKILTMIISFLSLNTAIILIKIFQMIDFFLLINVNPPTNVKEFINYFQSNVLDFMPNVFYVETSQSRCNLDMFLSSNGMSCNALNNIGHLIFESMFFFGIIAVVKSGRFVAGIFYERSQKEKDRLDSPGQTSKKNSGRVSWLAWMYQKVSMLDNWMNQGLVWSLLSSMELDLFLGSWTTLKVKGLKHSYFFFSNIMLLGLILSFCWYSWRCVMIYLETMSVIRNLKDIDEQVKRLEMVRKDNKSFYTSLSMFKKECHIGPLIKAFETMRDLVLPFVLIFWVGYPVIQIMAIMTTSVIFLAVVTVKKPFSEPSDHLVAVLNSILQIMALMLFMTLSILGDNISPFVRYYFIGLNIIAVFSLLLSANIIVGIAVSGMSVYSYVSSWNKKRNKKNRVLGQNTPGDTPEQGLYSPDTKLKNPKKYRVAFNRKRAQKKQMNVRMGQKKIIGKNLMKARTFRRKKVKKLERNTSQMMNGNNVLNNY